MTFKTHYEPVPVTEKPPVGGWYFTLSPDWEGGVKTGHWNETFQCWMPADRITHWLRPRPDTVLLTREEVEEIFQAGADHELDRHNPDLETYINNQFK